MVDAFWARLHAVRVCEMIGCPAPRAFDGPWEILVRQVARHACFTTRLPAQLASLHDCAGVHARGRALRPPPSPMTASPPLSPGVKAVWSLERAAHEVTPTRERVSINGLWRWQPALPRATEPPPDG